MWDGGGKPSLWERKIRKTLGGWTFLIVSKGSGSQKNPLAGSILRVISSCFLLGQQGEEIQIPHSVTLGLLATWSRGTKPGLRAGLRRGECKGVLWVEGWPFGEDHLGKALCQMFSLKKPSAVEWIFIYVLVTVFFLVLSQAIHQVLNV